MESCWASNCKSLKVGSTENLNLNIIAICLKFAEQKNGQSAFIFCAGSRHFPAYQNALRQLLKEILKNVSNHPKKVANSCILNCDHVRKVRNRYNTQAHVAILI